MTDTEKITINIGSVDLGQIDLLVKEGFYSNRADFIRTAIRNQLERQSNAVDSIKSRKSMVIGTQVYSSRDLMEKKDKNEKVNIKVVGMLILTDDITPQLAQETIESITIHGVFKAPEDIKDALKDRIS
jgi:Arc/MetJ-type ribon-helix-helix transcriptional regulator